MSWIGRLSRAGQGTSSSWRERRTRDPPLVRSSHQPDVAGLEDEWHLTESEQIPDRRSSPATPLREFLAVSTSEHQKSGSRQATVVPLTGQPHQRSLRRPDCGMIGRRLGENQKGQCAIKIMHRWIFPVVRIPEASFLREIRSLRVLRKMAGG